MHNSLNKAVLKLTDILFTITWEKYSKIQPLLGQLSADFGSFWPILANFGHFKFAKTYHRLLQLKQ